VQHDNLVSQGVSNTGQIGHATFCSTERIVSSKVIKNWVESYLRAALEVDRQKMRGRIVAAREAVAERLKDLEGNSDHHVERHDMQSALAALTCLEDEVRIWPTAAFTLSKQTVLPNRETIMHPGVLRWQDG
jgi:hypothetical protein